ncbi:hypothetical protein LTR17_026676 [Elasticomyces elasticus]|nr:hypothetical protein LTR17_026676 [Elasticomyces elasticus]
MSTQHTYHLSSNDQSLVRTYIRYWLCFPVMTPPYSEDTTPPTVSAQTGTSGNGDIDTAISRLHDATERAITALPILAGTIHSVPGRSFQDQQGRLEVRVSLQDVSEFRATVQFVQPDALLFHSYSSLSDINMPPEALIGYDLPTPLPDTPITTAATNCPAFAVQGTIIEGGLLVALYLHHTAADIQGLGKIIEIMSDANGIPRGLNDEVLRADAELQSTARSRLSGVWGVKASPDAHAEYSASPPTPETSQLTGGEIGTSCVLGFNLEIIEQTKEMINTRYHDYYDEQIIHISAFDCLAGILWKAVSRASWPNGPPEDDSGRLLQLTIPVGIRNRLDLPGDYFGNALVHAAAWSRVLELGKPYELSALAHQAKLVRLAVARITEPLVESKIATINSIHDVSKARISNRTFDTNLVITSWADLPTSEEEAGLSLGLGAPEWGRKIGRENKGYGCIVLPVKREGGIWEVQVTLTKEIMARMMEDEGLMKFVRWAA